MVNTTRPLSPHIQIYRWQVQMVTSILHRATGIALFAGLFFLVWGLVALAAGPLAYAQFRACAGSYLGMVLLIGWSWSLFYHLCNGIRHLIQDAGVGYPVQQFVRSSWLSVIVSLVLTLLALLYAWMPGVSL